MPRVPAITIASLVTSVLAAGARPAAADDGHPPVRTHTSPFSPTGELLRGGQLQRGFNLAGQWDLAVGLADHVELRMQNEVAFAGDLQLRVAVTPASSRFHLVVGGGAAGTAINGAKAWLGGSLTAAYRDDAWEAHATARLWDRLGPGVDLGLATAGLSGRFGRDGRHRLFVDVGQIAWHEAIACFASRTSARTAGTVEPAPAPTCDETGDLVGVAFGVWFGRVRDDMSVGVSAIVARVGDTVIPIAPLLSLSWGD